MKARFHRLAAGVSIGLAGALAASCAVPPAPLLKDPPPDPGLGDPALASYSIMAPGNGNVVGFTSAFSDDQRGPYDRLIDAVANGSLTDSNLGSYFKAAPLGTDSKPSRPIVRTQNPRPGVTVSWDDHGVPHIVGNTENQVGFGAGWAVAEARMFVADLARILGRAGTIEMIGGISSLDTAFAKIGSVPSLNYTDAELNASIEAVIDTFPDGQRALAAAEGFVEGINAWKATNPFPEALAALGIVDRPWTLADVVAVGIAVDDIFGAGGGEEVGNAEHLRALGEEFGEERAKEIYDTFRMAEVPGTTHTDQEFPFPLFAGSDGGPVGPANIVDPAAVAIPDADADMEKSPTPPPSASNYVAVSGDRTASGHPILVGGPQSAYVSPQLLFEMELHGAGYDTRGITFPGLGPWVVIGRGRDYAWTATAGGSDLVDQRIEKLCEPDGSAPTTNSRHYEFNGVCTAMAQPDPAAAWRSVHGPIVGTATVDGAPVAVAQQRSSRGIAANAIPSFWRLNQGQISSGAEFPEVMADIPMSFNWVYADSEDIAYFHSGLYPIRAEGVDPDLPSWGTGEWEWRGFLDHTQQPQVVNPTSGYLVSWNNRIAPGWRAADNSWAVGSVQRVDMLENRARIVQNASPADIVRLVQTAATTDLRGELVLPAALELLEVDQLGGANSAAARALEGWLARGSQRRDRDNNGFYDDPSIPVADAFYSELLRRVFEPQLGEFFSSEGLRRPKMLDNTPNLVGSSFQGGWYSNLTDELTASAAGSGEFCGDGTRAGCAAVVADALSAAVWMAGPLPMPTVAEQIRFLPILTNASPMRWQNRPTYQQVVSFGD